MKKLALLLMFVSGFACADSTFVGNPVTVGDLTDSAIPSGNCLQTTTGGHFIASGSPCGSGSNVGVTTITAGTGISVVNSTGPNVTISALIPSSTNYILNQNILQSGATAYPEWLYVGSTNSSSGPLTLRNDIGAYSGPFGNISQASYLFGNTIGGTFAGDVEIVASTESYSQIQANSNYGAGYLQNADLTGFALTPRHGASNGSIVSYSDGSQLWSLTNNKLNFSEPSEFSSTAIVDSTFTVKGGTVSINGTNYFWQAGSGGSGQFLQNNNGTITSATPSSGGGGVPSLYVASVTSNASIIATTSGTQGSTVTISVNPSSGTLQGNVFNGANQLLQLNSSDKIPDSLLDSSSVTLQGPIVSSITLSAMWGSPTLTGTNITSIPAASISAGSLGSSVLVSSLTQVTTAGTYGSSTISPTITFNSQGQIISASSNTISGGSGVTVYAATATASFPFGVAIGTTNLTTAELFLVANSTTIPLIIQDPTPSGGGTGSVDLTEWKNNNGIVLSSVTLDGSMVTSSTMICNSFQVISPTVTLNGTTYYWQAGTGSVGQVLQTNGSAQPTLSFITLPTGISVYPATSTIIANGVPGIIGISSGVFQAITLSTNPSINVPLQATLSMSSNDINPGLAISTNTQLNGSLAVVSLSTYPNVFTNGINCQVGALQVSSITAIAGGVSIQASTGTAALAGTYGQTISSAVTTATNLPATTTFGDLAIVTLSSGAWIVSLVECEQANGATLTSGGFIGISTTSGNSSSLLNEGDNKIELPLAAATDGCGSIPGYFMLLTSNTNVYAKMEDAYTVGQPQMIGRISAIRPY